MLMEYIRHTQHTHAHRHSPGKICYNPQNIEYNISLLVLTTERKRVRNKRKIWNGGDIRRRQASITPSFPMHACLVFMNIVWTESKTGECNNNNNTNFQYIGICATSFWTMHVIFLAKVRSIWWLSMTKRLWKSFNYLLPCWCAGYKCEGQRITLGLPVQSDGWTKKKLK